MAKSRLFTEKIRASSTSSRKPGESALSSAGLCWTSIHRVILAPIDPRTFAILSFLNLNLVPAVKENAGNERTSRTAAGVGVSAVGVGLSVVEGRGLCR